MSLEALRWVKFPVLNDGFVTLVDAMGTDASIVQAARVSYNKDVRSEDAPDDEKLLRFLMRHGHCYAPWMQVLTSRGWIQWADCNSTETFLVPDPSTRTMRLETLEVEQFYNEEGLETYKNERMSYAVTSEHTMWFRGKYSESFDRFSAQDMPKWGHFDPLRGYELKPTNDTDLAERAKWELLGFYLGDGSRASTNQCTFHLRKPRKIAYIRSLFAKLGIESKESPSSTYQDAIVFRFCPPQWLLESMGSRSSARYADKGVPVENWRLADINWRDGVRIGLESSDGSIKTDREQITMSSTSANILALYQAICAVSGIDAHESQGSHGVGIVNSFSGSRTSLESRKQYHSFREYAGPVYCTTTSTGFLMVRGSSSDFSFVCGNSTPFEMCEIKVLIRIPMDAWRQMIRHRTASVNEYSTRYTTAIDSKATTPPQDWRLQAKSNKQGSEGFLSEWTAEAAVLNANLSHPYATPNEYLSAKEEALHKFAQSVYDERVSMGIALEQARKDLPLSTYTEAYWKIDLHNLLHFLEKRLDPTAQLEIRLYAKALAEIAKDLWPQAFKAFEDYRLNSMKLSALDIEVIQNFVRGEGGKDLAAYIEDIIKDKRERSECLAKLTRLGFISE